ncbi:hypothetical protein PPL_09304 [Heterostelium album PN500]|uniref:FAD synthase n=1 Tax=Heterostelium pallidum (strain ATCC 26659 / Pp 5 / PN500) TaxID=670386 RepID=D3BL72_HETP5|nr:hypothetical protein PPL_09304 [Heterostelium album PN500]EFA77806.1 hypothetical protein PPL_09304 [Heterostelium album PN500]|eukprot:XP_020429934.1 hypothetical protein PPL_09304 [Heterostelium album PN500]
MMRDTQILFDLSNLDDDITDDPSLIEKINKSIATIELTFNKYKFEEIALCFNGGKDCVVLLHLMNYVLVKRTKQQKDNNIDNNNSIDSYKLRTLYFHSEDSFKEVTKFTDYCSKIYNLHVESIDKGLKDGLEQQVNMHSIKAIFAGTRSTDPYSSHLTEFTQTDPSWPQFIRVSPILEWNYADVWKFIRTFKIPYCVLYDEGYTSIGHVNDTIPNPALLDESTGKYLPAYHLKDGTLERSGRLKKVQ